jgi:hypothetical protein
MDINKVIELYQNGTLAEQSDPVLQVAAGKVSSWLDWRRQHPDAKPDALPKADVLQQIFDFILSLSNRRYGCND